MNQSVLLLLSIVMLLGFFALLAVSKGNTNNRRKRLDSLKSEMYKLKNFDKNTNESERRDLLIRMDSVFTKGMNNVLYNDLSFADNFKQIKHKFDKNLYNDIWEAHKKRNQVVHESSKVTTGDLQKHAGAFYKGINKL